MGACDMGWWKIWSKKKAMTFTGYRSKSSIGISFL